MTAGSAVGGGASGDRLSEAAALALVQRFCRRSSRVQCAAELEQLLAVASRKLGFAYYALVNHGSLARPKALKMTNYPDRWQDRFRSEALDRIDPVQQACRGRVGGFRWSQLDELVAMTASQRALLRASRVHGIGDGFTVPLHLAGAQAASCSFAVVPGVPLARAALPAAQLLGLAAYDRVRALHYVSDGRAITLSPRQRACVALIAAGLTDGGVARELGLSEETVTKYLNAARRRNGLARRAQLVAAALRDGLIGYADLAGEDS